MYTPGSGRLASTASLASLLFLSLPRSGLAAPQADPCASIAGKQFVPSADALACFKSFPFNETLRQNVLTTVSRVFDFFTFEEYYLRSPPPFQESTVNIRQKLAKLNSTKFATDYDFNIALYDFTTQLNDGHTRWYHDCYYSFQNILPAPVVILDTGVYVAPDSVEYLSQFGSNFTSYFDSIGFNWKRLAGAQILLIDGQSPYTYIDTVARLQSGNYLDHGIRVNSAITSYRVAGTPPVFSQGLGILAGAIDVRKSSLTLTLKTAGSSKIETVKVPYLANYLGLPFTDSASFWANNCLAKSSTNGASLNGARLPRRKQPKAELIEARYSAQVLPLPSQYSPTLTPVAGSDGVIKSFILPDKKTGVMFVGSFGGDFDGFQSDVVSAMNAFKAAGVTQLLIDLTNNGGGYVCLGQFLHQYLAGADIGYGGFVSTARANPLAKKIVAADIALGVTSAISFYGPDNWAFLNGTTYPTNYNYIDPSLPLVVNGVSDPTSQRFEDVCTPYFTQPIPKTAPFDLKKVAIVNNGNCASTCAMFSTLMYERHNTKIAVFGGKPGERVEFKGMAGNQVLEWPDLDTEIKTAGLKNDPLAPPDLLVAGNMRVNWRTAWSWLDEKTPIAYRSELPQYRFPYTKDTYNNPQNLWTFAAKKILG